MTSKPAMPALDALFSQEAEDAVIGAVMIAPQMFKPLSSMLNASDFYLLRHQSIWAAALKLDRAHTVIDFVTLQDALKSAGQLADVGGPAYLLNLINNTPTAAYAEVYAGIVKRMSTRRQLLKAADAIKALATEDLPTEDVLEKAESQLAAISMTTAGELVSMSEVMDQHMAMMERAIESPGSMAGLPSVIPGLGRLIGGYQAGGVYLIAGRPGMGKSSFLISEALNLIQMGKRVAFFSIEMTKDQITSSLIAPLTGVPVKALIERSLTTEQYSAYVQGAGKLGKLPIHMDDAKITPRQVAARVRKLQYTHQVDCVMIDYLQLMKAPFGVKDEEYPRVTAVSIELAELAKELGLPVLVAAQLNRDAEKRNDKRPMLSDLRSSGQLEQDATAVIFPYRAAADNPEMMLPVDEVEIGVAKNRYGPPGMVRCGFRTALKQFVPTYVASQPHAERKAS